MSESDGLTRERVEEIAEGRDDVPTLDEMATLARALLAADERAEAAERERDEIEGACVEQAVELSDVLTKAGASQLGAPDHHGSRRLISDAERVSAIVLRAERAEAEAARLRGEAAAWQERFLTADETSLGAEVARLRAERDALRARVAALEGALRRARGYVESVVREDETANCICGNPHHAGHANDCPTVGLLRDIDAALAPASAPAEFSVQQQIVRDPASGLTIQFMRDDAGRARLRLWGDALPFGNREIGFGEDGAEAFAGTFVGECPAPSFARLASAPAEEPAPEPDVVLVDDVVCTPMPRICTIWSCRGRVVKRERLHVCEKCGLSYGAGAPEPVCVRGWLIYPRTGGGMQPVGPRKEKCPGCPNCAKGGAR